MLRNPGLRKSVEQPVLDLNFAASQIGSNGAPDARMNDFNRGSNAWFVDSDGLVKKSPHNLLLQSEDFGTTWSAIGDVTVATNEIVAPDGTTTADKISSANFAAGGNHIRQSSGTIDAGTYTASVFVKAGSLDTFKFRIVTFAPSTVDANSVFDLSTGEWTSINVNHTVSTEAYPNDWFRLSLTFSNPASGAVQPRFAASSGSGFVYVWGAQLSQHTTLPIDNPYIKTEGSAVYAARLDHDPEWFMSAAQEQNLLQTSDLDDNTQYGLGRSTIAEQSSVENPFGGTDGVYLHLESAVGGSSYIYAFSATNWQQYLTEGKQYTLSIYAKQFSGQKLELRSPNSDFRNARFNVDTGVIEQQDSLLDDATIEDVGNGWFRCSITDTIATFSPTTWILAYLYNDLASPDYGLYYYGAQLEVGSTASTYHRTEGAPYYGPGATPKGLLIEEQRANLATDSEDFTAASWSATNSTVTANQVLAPDGTTTADLWTRSSTSAAYLNDDVTKSAVSQDYSVSCFVKKSVGDYAAVRFQSTYPARVDGVFNLSTGAVHSLNAVTLTNEAATIEDYGNGWFRCTVSGTSDATVVLRAAVSFNSNGVQVDFTDTASDSAGFVWGFQIEQGSFPTSYIQTTGTTLTRDADVAVMGPTTGGTELVTNGTFDTDTTGWTLGTTSGTTATVSSGVVTISASTASGAGMLYQSAADTPTVIGRRYRATAELSVVSGSGVSLVVYSSFFSGLLGSSNITSGTDRIVTVDFTATTTATHIAIQRLTSYADTDEYKVDNVSVRELYPFEQYNPSEGTLFVEATQTGEGSNFASVAAIVQEGSNDNDLISIYRSASNDRIQFALKSGGTLSADTGLTNARSLGTAYKFAGSYLENSASVSLDGLTRADDTSVTIPAVDQLLFYGDVNFQGNIHSGYIKRFRYYKRKLDKVTLQSLTSD